MAETQHAFEALLDYLKRSRGVDLTGYKRPSLMRRFERLMTTAGIKDYADYISYLEASPGEVVRVLDTILINVTGFFRDASAWEVLQKEAIPNILAAKKPTDPIRVWTAGCASGQEAYTIAIILAEAIGVDAVRECVKIHATDLDEEALAYARTALYTEREVQGVPPPLLEKYFERSNGRYAVEKNLRRSVIFGRHDLIQDVPISRLDLLVCRNTLMYFNADVQSHILARFHFALNPGGFMFLGKAEMLVRRSALFTPVDLRRRIFMKERNSSEASRALFVPDLWEASRNDDMSISGLALQAGPLPHVIVGADGALLLASDRARLLFRFTSKDIGRQFYDLPVSYQPVELRTPIQKSSDDRKPLVLRGALWTHPDGDASIYDIHIAPLVGSDEVVMGVCISFVDITDYRRTQDELEAANKQLALAYEGTQSANEELETVNEELQSSSEELETTNEELQSTNEELETMNEELQSSAEELETTNDELRIRGLDLAQMTEFLESLMSSLPGGLVVVGPDLEVQAWNHKAEDLWGMRRDESVGKNLMSLDIGLQVEKLYPLVRSCLTGSSSIEEITLDATNRRGKAIVCKISCMPVVSRGVVRGAMLLMNPLLTE
ncbi:MAG TPA: CheR family methyltransferase [Capsulimonadaceae bacterium]|nr:CheR family methyltransferase [Capsulimonadaceae bacterium]